MNNQYIEKTEEDYEAFSDFIEEIKLLSPRHREFMDNVIFKPTSDPRSCPQTKELIQLLDLGAHQEYEEKEWFLEDFMKELIEDGFDIDIPINKLPVVLYA